MKATASFRRSSGGATARELVDPADHIVEVAGVDPDLVDAVVVVQDVGVAVGADR